MRRPLRVSRHRLRRSLHWLLAQEGTPGQRARGLAAGVFCGCFPFFGLQIVVSVGVASLLRGNHLLAAAGTLVSNPFTYIPLYWFNYLVGAQLLGPSDRADALSSINRSNFWLQGWDFTQRILLGSSLVGLIVAVVSGLVAYKLFQRHSAQPSSPITVSNQTPKGCQSSR